MRDINDNKRKAWKKNCLNLVRKETICSGISDKMFTCVEIPKDRRNMWNQLIRQKEMKLRPKRHIDYISDNRSMLHWLFYLWCYVKCFPQLFPPSPPLLGLHITPLTSPTPLEVDELIQQQEGASQVGDVGLWTATVAGWMTTWNAQYRKTEGEKDKDGHGKAEGKSKEYVVLQNDDNERWILAEQGHEWRETK